jgi:hypothetical protein
VSDAALAQSVDRLANLTQGLADSALERAWAWRSYDSEGVRFAFFRTYEELRGLAVNLRQERYAQGLPFSTAQLILSDYHAAYHDLQASLLGVGPDLAERAPSENDWSLRKVLSHIVGADLGFYVVVRYALDRHRSNDGRPEEIPDEAWDAISGMDEAAYRAQMGETFQNLRTYHRSLHERVLSEFAGIQEQELESSSRFWEKEPMSLRFRLHRFDSHMRQHTIQIDMTLERLNQSQSEVKRLLRLIYGALAHVESALIGAEIEVNSRRDLARSLESRIDEIAGVLS